MVETHMLQKPRDADHPLLSGGQPRNDARARGPRHGGVVSRLLRILFRAQPSSVTLRHVSRAPERPLIKTSIKLRRRAVTARRRANVRRNLFSSVRNPRDSQVIELSDPASPAQTRLVVLQNASKIAQEVAKWLRRVQATAYEGEAACPPPLSLPRASLLTFPPR